MRRELLQREQLRPAQADAALGLAARRSQGLDDAAKGVDGKAQIGGRNGAHKEN
jgi:hypothetical protein